MIRLSRHNGFTLRSQCFQKFHATERHITVWPLMILTMALEDWTPQFNSSLLDLRYDDIRVSYQIAPDIWIRNGEIVE